MEFKKGDRVRGVSSNNTIDYDEDFLGKAGTIVDYHNQLYVVEYPCGERHDWYEDELELISNFTLGDRILVSNNMGLELERIFLAYQDGADKPWIVVKGNNSYIPSGDFEVSRWNNAEALPEYKTITINSKEIRLSPESHAELKKQLL